MAVNKEFYKTINELTNRSITGDITEPIDAATWIDYGKTMQELDGQNLVNNVHAMLFQFHCTHMGCIYSFQFHHSFFHPNTRFSAELISAEMTTPSRPMTTIPRMTRSTRP